MLTNITLNYKLIVETVSIDFKNKDYMANLHVLSCPPVLKNISFHSHRIQQQKIFDKI